VVIGTNIGAEKVLSVDSYRNIGEHGLNIPLNGVLPLLIWCGAFMSAMMLLVKLVGFIIGPEGGIILWRTRGLNPRVVKKRVPVQGSKGRSLRCRF
jgi:hypothetical protein